MADEIVISTNAGDVIKADDDSCYSNPVETSEPVTGEEAQTSFAVCGTCLDCAVTTATDEERMENMYVRVAQKTSRVPAPTMKLRITDPSALIATTVDWCGQLWTFPADNGKCYEIKPNNYQMRNVAQSERFNRKALNYNYIKGIVQLWAGSGFDTGTSGRYVHVLPVAQAMNRWDMSSNGGLERLNMAWSYKFSPYAIDTIDGTANVRKNWIWKHTLRVIVPGGSPSHRPYPLVQSYNCATRFKGCAYSRVGNKFYVDINNCTNTYCTDCCTNTANWPAALAFPSPYNYRLSSTTRPTTSTLRTARKGQAISASGLVYEWEMASDWGVV